MAFTNVSPDPDYTGLVRDTDYDFLRRSLEGHRPIIALGAVPEHHIKKLGYDCFRLPHPSGLNHQMNDKVWVWEQVHLAMRILERYGYYD